MNGILIIPAFSIFNQDQVDLILEENLEQRGMVCDELYKLFTSYRPTMLSSLIGVSFPYTDKVYLVKVRNYKEHHTTEGLCDSTNFKELLSLNTETLGV